MTSTRKGIATSIAFLSFFSTVHYKMCNQFTCLIRGKAILVCFYPLCIFKCRQCAPSEPPRWVHSYDKCGFSAEEKYLAGGAPGAHGGRTGGAINWALAQHWVGENEVLQCMGRAEMSWNPDLCHSCQSRKNFDLYKPEKKNYPLLRPLDPRPTSQRKWGGEPV